MREGTAKITTWESINPTALHVGLDNTIYLGKAGYLAKYTGYLDNNATYDMEYIGPWVDFGNTADKMPKIMRLHVFTGRDMTPIARWAFDYNAFYNTQTFPVSAGGGAEYSIDEYNIGEYSTGEAFYIASIPLSGHGKTLQFGITSTINGAILSLQRVDFFIKTGNLLK